MAIETTINRGQWFAGADLVWRFNIKQEDKVTAQDMTGWALKFIIRSKSAKGSIVFSKTTTSDIQIVNGAGTNDRANVTTVRADTLTLVEGWYWFSLWRTNDPNDTVLSFGQAYLTLVAGQ